MCLLQRSITGVASSSSWGVAIAGEALETIADETTTVVARMRTTSTQAVGQAAAPRIEGAVADM